VLVDRLEDGPDVDVLASEYMENREEEDRYMIRLTESLTRKIRSNLDDKIRELYRMMREPLTETMILKIKKKFVDLNIDILAICLDRNFNGGMYTVEE